MSEATEAKVEHHAMALRIRQNAALRLCELMQEAHNPHLMLRVYIIGGGCSGFQYGFKMEEHASPDDYIFKERLEDTADPMYREVRAVVDPLSFMYLEGAEVDYIRHLQGSRFVVHNPHAKTTCGCGSSFSV